MLNRLTNVYAEIQHNNYTALATTGSTNDDYATHITYYANGNIKNLLRNTWTRTAATLAAGNFTSNEMDNMTYNYAQTTTDFPSSP